MTFTLRAENCGSSFMTRASSVVQTGVKSAGWEKRIPHLRRKNNIIRTKKRQNNNKHNFFHALNSRITNPVMEINISYSCFSLEVGKYITQIHHFEPVLDPLLKPVCKSPRSLNSRETNEGRQKYITQEIWKLFIWLL